MRMKAAIVILTEETAVEADATIRISTWTTITSEMDMATAIATVSTCSVSHLKLTTSSTIRMF